MITTAIKEARMSKEVIIATSKHRSEKELDPYIAENKSKLAATSTGISSVLSAHAGIVSVVPASTKRFMPLLQDQAMPLLQDRGGSNFQIKQEIK